MEIVAHDDWRYKLIDILLIEPQLLTEVLDAILFNGVWEVRFDDIGGGQIFNPMLFEVLCCMSLIDAFGKLQEEVVGSELGKAILHH